MQGLVRRLPMPRVMLGHQANKPKVGLHQKRFPLRRQLWRPLLAPALWDGKIQVPLQPDYHPLRLFLDGSKVRVTCRPLVFRLSRRISVPLRRSIRL